MVKLPLSAAAYWKHVKTLIAKSKPVKKPKAKSSAPAGMSASFGKAQAKKH